MFLSVFEEINHVASLVRFRLNSRPGALGIGECHKVVQLATMVVNKQAKLGHWLSLSVY